MGLISKALAIYSQAQILAKKDCDIDEELAISSGQSMTLLGGL